MLPGVVELSFWILLQDICSDVNVPSANDQCFLVR